MSKLDDEAKKIYEDAKNAMERLCDKKYLYHDQDCVYDDLRTVKKLIDSFENGDWWWENAEPIEFNKEHLKRMGVEMTKDNK